MNISRAISQVTFFRRRYHQSWMCLRISACVVLTAAFSLPQPAAATDTTVRMVTTLGTIDIQLFDDQAPITVANFLRYAGSGYYSTYTTSQGAPAVGFIHRRATINFDGVSVIQGGGYAYSDLRTGGNFVANYVGYSHVPTAAPIQNEFSPTRSNRRGTIAMAKTADPNSATSEWFINLDDNSAALDDTNNSGGFTVFGQVISGMNYVDDIGNLTQVNTTDPSFTCSTPCNLPIAALNEVPVNNYNPSTGLDPSNLVSVTSIPNVISTTTLPGYLATFTTDVDMTFGYAQTLPQSISTTLLDTFTPPPNKTVQFNDGILRFAMTGVVDPTGRIVTLRNDDPTTPNHYYAYGPTADDLTPHWYDFTFDSTTGTGAEFVGNKILLHFVDGQRGDNDPTVNSIIHIGAPVLMTDTVTSTSSSGCSIAATPSPMRSSGDWIVVSMFLAFVALVRRRAHCDRN